MNKEKVLVDNLLKLNINLTNNQIEQFIIYYHMMIETNKVMNLTSITEYEEVVLKHFADSLVLVKAIDVTKNIKLIDVGTGAGFPGIPLKIVFPNIDIVLLDSLNKRINFLNEVIIKLGLNNITTIHSRAEDAGRDIKYREQFDVCVSRAVANLSTLLEYCMPFVRVGGNFISYKSGNIDDEIKESKKAIKSFGGSLKDKTTFNLINSEYQRSLVVISKDEQISNKYPRKSGVPSKNPIKF